jgi:predicted PurR-regulated permease PerM
MEMKPTAGWFYAALIIVLSGWILHSFITPLLSACVIAIASWPLYGRFAARMPRHVTRGATALIFTCLVTVFVLVPLIVAVGALAVESQAVIQQVAAADRTGIAVPSWLERVPVAGAWLASRWQSELGFPGALSNWVRRADTTAILGWAQSLGEFMIQQVLIIGFTILALYFLYSVGESLALEVRHMLRYRIGERAGRYIDVATRSLRASVNGMFVVGLFDGFAVYATYAIAGVPNAAVWAAITGVLAVVPFLSYTAAAALGLKLAVTGAGAPALMTVGLACLILVFGDKIVRPMVGREGTQLRFVWVLMGWLGGFEVLGLVGLFVGPVVLTLAKELWQQRVRDLDLPDDGHSTSRSAHNGSQRS